VRNTKAKIRRTKKNYGIDLNSEVRLPPLEYFNTRAEFNEWKNEISSFTNRNNRTYQFKKNKYGVVASVAELNEIKRATKRAQVLADKKIREIEKLPFFADGEAQIGGVKQRIGYMSEEQVTGISRPRDFNFDKIHSRAKLEQRKRNVEDRQDAGYYDKKMEQMQQNFMEILRISFNTDADKLLKEIEQLTPGQFYEIYLQFGTSFDFDLYSSEGQMNDDNNHVEKMLADIERYKTGKAEYDLDGF